MAASEDLVYVPAGEVELAGDLDLPPRPRGVVAFAHGSGSSRHSPRNRYVASQLQRSGYATLLLDLLTAAEDRVDRRTRALRFDIPLLSTRLGAAVDWLAADERTSALPLATFGASTGAAAALVAAADRSERVRVVVSRGGRPDLAGDALERVTAPTLLVVGGDDPTVLRLNELAATRLRGPAEVVVVPGASHLFEEPGALDAVVRHAIGWLDRWLAA
jgi:putative phosphoribosyl transferase